MSAELDEELDEELRRLALSEQHIAETEQLLAEQIKHADELLERGVNSDLVTNAIAKLDSKLIEWRTQRDLTAERIRKLRVDQP